MAGVHHGDQVGLFAAKQLIGLVNTQGGLRGLDYSKRGCGRYACRRDRPWHQVGGRLHGDGLAASRSGRLECEAGRYKDPVEDVSMRGP